jgi:hypothetical protein
MKATDNSKAGFHLPGGEVMPANTSKCNITVSTHNGEYCVLALQPFQAGEAIMAIEGEVRATPCRYSVQVDHDLHIAPPEGMTSSDRHDLYLWRFLNHSCKPNAAIVRRLLMAVRPIQPGEQISFDYNTTEYEMASPFHCHCGRCEGVEIRGFRFLSPAQQAQRMPLLEPYLRDALDTMV